MAKKRSRPKTQPPSPPPKARPSKLPAWKKLAIGGFGLLLLIGAIVAARPWKHSHSHSHSRSTDPAASTLAKPSKTSTVTFTKDIAPIIFHNCSGCHRPGQPGPFNLLTYADVQKRAKQIASVTSKRTMPPWPPEPGINDFVGQRILSPQQVRQLQEWVQQGAPEGAPSDLPPLPHWADGWALGKPDLVLTMPQPYLLPSDGQDIYRNFVIPMSLPASRFIRAVEFQSASRSVHHAYLLFDRTRQCRRLDAETPEIGFEGMGQPGNAESPADTFLSWQPGKIAQDTQGSSWTLDPGMDLVLQMHMQTTGKPERVQASVGFYFGDLASTNRMLKIGLDSFEIDIPAGEREYQVQDSFRLPVDTEATAVYPHAHYLAKQLKAGALLPDGSKQPLLLIKNWDFKWQGDYRYAKPIFLPKGTTIQMLFTYDNSTNNIRNPHHPPRRVQFGLQTTDEMANLSFLLKVQTQQDLDQLSIAYQNKAIRSIVRFNELMLQRNPDDARSHAQLGKALLALGKSTEAAAHLQSAIALKPSLDDAHYHLGLILEDQNRIAPARAEYELALRYNPEHREAHNNLGLLCLKAREFDAAESHFQAALALAPGDPIVQENLQLLLQSRPPRPPRRN